MPICVHCGAPLREGRPVCDYCKATNDVDLSGRHYFTTHLPEKVRLCPQCRSEMEVVDVGVPRKPFYLDRCPKCLGIFFDTGELDVLVHETIQGVAHINNVRLSTLRAAAPESSEAVRYRPCPECGKLMNRQNYGTYSGIILDRCRDHGVFLDAGELYRIFLWVRAGGDLLKPPPEPERSKHQLSEAEIELEDASPVSLTDLVMGVFKFLGR